MPTALVTVIAIVSAIVLHDNGTRRQGPARVQVTAEQFTWLFKYQNGDGEGRRLAGSLPAGRPRR